MLKPEANSTGQVPDEILTLLNDPYIFSTSGENTSKEILKRFHERRGQIAFSDVNEVYNRQDKSTRPPPRRVETDPSVWQAETSVRHVQEPPNKPYAKSGQSTPPHQRFRGPSEPAPIKSQFDHSDAPLSGAEDGQRRDWRNSAWGRQGGGLGVGGNS